jgi:hypothetical protein
MAVVFFFSACAGFFPASGAAPPRTVVSEAAGTSDGNPVPDIPWFWNTAPSPDFLFFIGVSAIRSNREESIRLALEDAAKKVAMYHFLEARYESRIDTGSGFLEYRADTISSLDYDKDYLKYAGDLVYDEDRDILGWENSLFVRARYARTEGEIPPSAGIRAEVPAGPPPWVNTLPEGTPGYVYGVGFAGRRIYHRDTVNASCEAAVFSLIRNLSGQVTGATAEAWKDSAFGYSGAAGASVSSAMGLEGFYVLEVWIDPASKAVWTLALARKDEPAQSLKSPEDSGIK